MANPKPLIHTNAEATDEQLAREHKEFIDKSPTLKVLVALYATLRKRELPWWKPEWLIQWWPVKDRLHALEKRPDLRAKLLIDLANSLPKAARKWEAEFQASMLNGYLDAEDITPTQFESAFDPQTCVAYHSSDPGPAAFFFEFIDRLPQGEDTEPHQALLADLYAALVENRVFSAHDVLSTLNPADWEKFIPLEVRAKVRKARLDLEKAKASSAYTATMELAEVTFPVITSSIPIKLQLPLLDLATKKLGLERPKKPEAPVEDQSPKA